MLWSAYFEKQIAAFFWRTYLYSALCHHWQLFLRVCATEECCRCWFRCLLFSDVYFVFGACVVRTLRLTGTTKVCCIELALQYCFAVNGGFIIEAWPLNVLPFNWYAGKFGCAAQHTLGISVYVVSNERHLFMFVPFITNRQHCYHIRLCSHSLFGFC